MSKALLSWKKITKIMAWCVYIYIYIYICMLLKKEDLKKTFFFVYEGNMIPDQMDVEIIQKILDFKYFQL